MADTKAIADQWDRSTALALLFQPTCLNTQLWPQHFLHFTTDWAFAQIQRSRKLTGFLKCKLIQVSSPRLDLKGEIWTKPVHPC